jgi:hypothetical protein
MSNQALSDSDQAPPEISVVLLTDTLIELGWAPKPSLLDKTSVDFIFELSQLSSNIPIDKAPMTTQLNRSKSVEEWTILYTGDRHRFAVRSLQPNIGYRFRLRMRHQPNSVDSGEWIDNGGWSPRDRLLDVSTDGNDFDWYHSQILADTAAKERHERDFMSIIASKDGDEVAALLSKHITLAVSDARDKHGKTLLMQLAQNIFHRGDIFRKICRMGALVNARTAAGKTALMTAAASGNLECIETLLDQSADIDAVDNGSFRVKDVYSKLRGIYSFDVGV